MKQLCIYVLLSLPFVGFAQLPDGSIAPDFTAADINGQEWNLYSLLEEGKTVILDFSATWCPPCWSYHETHILRDLYDAYGPNGSDDLMVFFLEGDDGTTLADLNGTGDATAGDWVEGTTYPIIDNAANIFSEYGCTYFPTIYTVCPSDTTLKETGQTSFLNHATYAFSGSCGPVQAFPLLEVPSSFNECNGNPWTPRATLNNVGGAELTSAKLQAAVEGGDPVLTEWSGLLESGEALELDLNEITGQGILSISLVEVNGEAWNDARESYVNASVESPNQFRFTLLTDHFPQQSFWSFSDESGSEIAGVASGEDLVGNAHTEFVWEFSAPELGCYTFELGDTYGDGLDSEFGNWQAGSAKLEALDAEEVVATLFEHNGSADGNFQSLVTSLHVNTISAVQFPQGSAHMELYPNPASEVCYVQLPSAGLSQGEVVVMDGLGQIVSSMPFKMREAGQPLALDLSGLHPGMYLIEVRSAGETWGHRLIKQ